MQGQCDDERKGGGYKQREKRRALEEKQKLQKSHLAKYLVP